MKGARADAGFDKPTCFRKESVLSSQYCAGTYEGEGELEENTAFGSFFTMCLSMRHEVICFIFSREYFGVFETNGKKLQGDAALIPWEYITDFKVKKGRVEDALTFVYQGEKFEMQLSRVMRGQPWISENIENLEENNFYCGNRDLG